MVRGFVIQIKLGEEGAAYAPGKVKSCSIDNSLVAIDAGDDSKASLESFFLCKEYFFIVKVHTRKRDRILFACIDKKCSGHAYRNIILPRGDWNNDCADACLSCRKEGVLINNVFIKCCASSIKVKGLVSVFLGSGKVEVEDRDVGVAVVAQV